MRPSLDFRSGNDKVERCRNKYTFYNYDLYSAAATEFNNTNSHVHVEDP